MLRSLRLRLCLRSLGKLRCLHDVEDGVKTEGVECGGWRLHSGGAWRTKKKVEWQAVKWSVENEE